METSATTALQASHGGYNPPDDETASPGPSTCQEDSQGPFVEIFLRQHGLSYTGSRKVPVRRLISFDTRQWVFTAHYERDIIRPVLLDLLSSTGQLTDSQISHLAVITRSYYLCLL